MPNISSSIVWQLTEKILRIFSGLFIGIWIAKFLGTHLFGVYSYIQSFVGLFVALTTLGLDGVVVREITKNQNQNIYIGTALLLRLMGAVLLILILSVVMYFYPHEYSSLMMLYSFVFIIQAGLVFEYYFQSRVQGNIIGKVKIASLSLGILLKVYVILTGGTLFDFITVLMVESGIVSFLLVMSYSKQESLINLKVKLRYSIDLLKTSWPLIFSGFIMSVYMKIDQVMLYNMLSAEMNGIYASAVRISDSMNFIPVIICNVVFPLIIKLKSKSTSKYRIATKSLHSLMLWGAILLASFFTIFSEIIIRNTYGIEYIEAASVLSIYTWASIPVFLGVSSTIWILSENLQKYKLIMDVFGALLNIALNLYLIPKYGVLGAAYATLISYSLTLVLVSSIFPQLRDNLKMMVASLFMPIFSMKDIIMISRDIKNDI
ncbi:Flippase [Vibrio chagasii]|nr:Flippase [Vibrio chagasii]CAH6807180.1 Flippase [Vibrio chagasii]CAH6904256.1 Flippase [Vibrio chagasii]CAH6906237.1 Flippase [Vibrio chagasii]CAH6911424.1 Flippase [Vibrio chagasii]